MMGTKRLWKSKGGAEYDAFSRYARSIHFSKHRSRTVHWIKSHFWRRVRRHGRAELRQSLLDNGGVA